MRSNSLVSCRRNARTGRIRRTNPNPPAPRTYLDTPNVQTHLQLVERSPESHEFLYRRAFLAILKHFFVEAEGFDVVQEESLGETTVGETQADMSVLKILARPGGSMYAYDYCLVESKRADRSWPLTRDHLSRHCGSQLECSYARLSTRLSCTGFTSQLDRVHLLFCHRCCLQPLVSLHYIATH
ncbi:uncharacterized protein BDZ99DRAFT_160354 [Mytilinidion resinicola]|uniref:Uncharacterized protein n=1 Tax=Mytilinidion resinicola TaxID=574789 RepID=A0A6A6Y6P8_9PEZI|nr:uncharacterized protein BDZ99DRAFT_160354 [Mytilinidion resinicola]KAF2803694.1 hypothetical protein BDZ99DRAFT_160354 [Mytilinidion resinicola]